VKKARKYYTVKGFFSFAAEKSWRAGGKLAAAELMKPRGELNLGGAVDL
jgi:hypothetical protein